MSTEFADAPTDPKMKLSASDVDSYPDVEGPVNEHAIWRTAIALSAAVTPYEVAVALADNAAAAAGASFSNVAVLDADQDYVRVVSGVSVDPALVARWADRWAEFHITENLPLCDAMRTGTTVLLHSAEETAEKYPVMLPETVAASLSATASVPLVTAEGRTLGCIGFGWKAPQEFRETQVRRLELIAELGAQALNRAIFEQDRGHQTAKEEADAHVLQEAFLPAVLPQSARLELAATYLPALDAPMGGDWYDAFPVDRGMCLVVGDVGGHGLQSAAVMAQLRNAVRAFADEDPTPETIVTRLNRMLCRLEPDETATCIVAVWDEETGIINRTNAGHPAVLRCRIGETAFLLPDASDVLLGADPGWQYKSESKFLRPGTTLLLYTDGLVELRGHTLDEGMDALREFVESLDDLSPETLCSQILDWRLKTASREDDICVLAVRVH
ncbi:MAG TPA: GAF domain-containing SpoIIE family protein phosphatase [Actinomycetota bacterium]|jgi:serine phosphatase RsbU (regulator of sigma subunit)|nr:GAF domain-containing SpoIIE family protein phosphatase [Actinomycetota bacterium]